MVTFRRILVCLAATLVTWGMSHQAPAHDSDENEASERHGSHNEGSEQTESHDEEAEHHGNSRNETSSNSSSSSSSSNRGSANDDRNGTASSREDSSRSASTTTTTTRNALSTATTSSRTSATSRSDRGSERKARLRSFVGGRGSAEYKTSGTNRSFEVELENTSLSPGQTLSVCVNDVSVGAMTVFLSGRRTKAKLKLETRRGHAVPTISAGSVVTVKLTTATVASGTF